MFEMVSQWRLCCLLYTLVRTGSFKVILLTHANELNRVSNTARIITTVGSTELTHVEKWVWRGRVDNNHVTSCLGTTVRPVLVWTEAPSLSSSLADDCKSQCLNTYIILDGTWQEAKKMFRHGPDAIRSIPRVSLEPSFLSDYRLRGNYGYRNRFGQESLSVSADVDTLKSIPTDGTPSAPPQEDTRPCSLLCTAEVVAALLEVHGDHSGKADVLRRLEDFQIDIERNSRR
jgi:DTW domain-containing protein